MATLGEYLGAGSGTTKLLLHLNGSSADSSGNGNNGTDTAITYSQANGRFGMGAGFNGSTSVIDTGTYLAGMVNDFTISVWVKPGEPQMDYACIYGNQNQANYPSVPFKGCALQQSASTDNTFYFTFGVSSTVADTTTFALTPSVWSKVDVVKSSSAGTKVYVNGVQVASTATNTDMVACDTYTFKIGRGWQGGNRLFKGAIDEVIIDATAWSAEKVKKQFTYAKGRFGII